jgi:uroporphyrinogen-III decarboxylase
MDNNWAVLHPEEKKERMFDSWATKQKINFISPEAEKAYRERVTRIKDVVQLKVPDRVPIYANIGFFSTFYEGISPKETMYDYDKLVDAWRNCILDLKPDVHGGSAIPGPEKAFKILDYKPYLWPVHGTPSDIPYQCVESNYMEADEYDALIQDPSDFLLRKFLPRIFGALEPFKKFDSLANLIELPFTDGYLVSYGRPDVQSALETLMEAGEEAIKWRKTVNACNKAVVEAGYPLISGGGSKAPFDALADTLRGTQGIMIDMYQQPDKLLEALERLTPLMLRLGIEGALSSGRPMVFIALHNGADDFMSEKQYQTFYWPTLKKLILGLVSEGLVPFILAEGSYNTRLETIRDIPRATTIWHFDFTDMAKAKEVLGDTACIAGNVPISLLNTGTPDEVKDYCKELIDVAAENGGFIMTSGGVIDKAKLENVRAMIEFTKEYGVYD